MGRKKRKQRLSSGSSSDQSFTQTPTKKQSTVLGYFSKIKENIETQPVNMESDTQTKILKDSSTSAANMDIESMSDRDMLKLILCDIKDIKESLKYQDNEIADLKEKVCALEEKTTLQEQSMNNMKTQIQHLERKQIEAECYTKRMNLILRNVPFSEQENLTVKAKAIFTETLQIDSRGIVFDTIHRLKRDNNAVIMRFVRFDDRQLVWRARAKLRGTDLKLHEHFPREIEIHRRNILPVYVRAKQIQSTGTSLFRDEITFRGRKYTIHNIDSLTEQLCMTDLNARFDDNVYLFFGKMSHLSNFHHQPFECEGKSLSCVEQGYQAEKARFAGRNDLAGAILQMNDPVQMKRTGDSIADDEWYASGMALTAMKKLLVAKFTQCAALRKTLMNTGERTLVESSPSSLYWGSGMHMRHKDAMNTDVYKGSNHMGRLLMEVRVSIKG